MQNTGRATAEKSFIVEALIISLSNFVVKIIGVLFKIPMTYILGVNMGIFNAAYSIYAMLFMLSTAGLPVAISRLVASANERGRPREIRMVYRLSVTMFGLIGLFCSLLLFFGRGGHRQFFRAPRRGAGDAGHFAHAVPHLHFFGHPRLFPGTEKYVPNGHQPVY